MENSCLKKYKPSSKKWILASRCAGLRRNSALIPANAGLFHYAGNNPVRYIDPDGKKLYICGSKQYMAAVQSELKSLCSDVIINFDTGEVSLSACSKNTGSSGYELLSSLITSPKTNIIWLGNSRIKDKNGDNTGNSAYPFNTRITLKNGKFEADFNIIDNKVGDMNSVINFDPNNWIGGDDDNGSPLRPPFVGLSHESGHSEAINNGTQTYEQYIEIPGTTPNREKNSMKWENKIREEHNMTKRTYYYPPISEGE